MNTREIITDIPARIDRLPWSRFHLLVVVALGITWVLDGLEVTIVGSIGPILKDRQTLGLSDQEIGSIAACYVAGAVAGALLFGWLTDRFGRRVIFNVTLGIYLAGVLLTAFSWSFWSFAIFRCLTGLGIGGEYAAINSAIDELIPARLRGRVDLIVNGSYWAGAALGAAGSLLLLSGRLVGIDLGWRLGFGIGAALGGFILFLRRFVPESPRWQVTHGRDEEAKRNTDEIERKVGHALPPPKGTLKVHPRKVFGFGIIFAAMLHENCARSFLALTLMVAQAFLFNAVFFTYGLVLSTFYHVQDFPDRHIHPAIGRGEFFGAIAARAAVRHGGPQTDDRRHIWHVRLYAHCRGGPVRKRRPWPLDADLLLDRDLLYRFGGSKFGVPYYERDFSSGDSRNGYRGVLCARHAVRRRHRPIPVRPVNWHRQ